MSKRAMTRWGFRLVLLAGILASAGCSATQQISDAASSIRKDAQHIRDEVKAAKDANAAGDKKAVDDHLNNIDKDASHIVTTTDQVQKALTKVEDSVPWWATTIKWVIVAGIIALVIFLLWRFNLLLLAEKVIQKLVSGIALALGA